MRLLRALRALFLVWVIVPLALLAAYHIWGLPHFIWSYSFRGGEQGFTSRWYVRCTYLGPYGAVVTHPTNGKCGWVRFATEAEAKS